MTDLNDVKDKLKEVDLEAVVDTVEKVVDAVEVVNASGIVPVDKQDNVQKGVSDARKVLGVAALLKSILSVFKRK